MAYNYIPRADRKCLVWIKVLFTNVRENAELWNLLPESWEHIDPPMIAKYDNALTKAEDHNRGKVDVMEKNEARDALIAATRQYVNEFLRYNSAITDDDRIRMGLPVRKTTLTPVHVPNTLPNVTIKAPSPGVVEFHVVDSASGRKAKPAGIHGFEVAWAILDTVPTDWEQLTHSSFCTRTPLRLSFSGKNRGKTLYFALRWENTRGVKGPWSEIFNTIIP